MSTAVRAFTFIVECTVYTEIKSSTDGIMGLKTTGIMGPVSNVNNINDGEHCNISVSSDCINSGGKIENI